VTPTQVRALRIPKWGTESKSFERSKKTAATLLLIQILMPAGCGSNECLLGGTARMEAKLRV